MEEDKGQGTVMGSLFSFPCALRTLSLHYFLSPRSGFFCAFAVLQTVKVLHIFVFADILGFCV